jgi:hypothetical protein
MRSFEALLRARRACLGGAPGVSVASWRAFAGQAPSRNPAFAALSDADLDFFSALLGQNNVIRDPVTLQGYNRSGPPDAPNSAHRISQ